MEFVAKGDSCALKREQIMTERKAEDAERYVRREEDKKYNIILTNRRQEDELMRTKRQAEDTELWNIEKMIEDGELVSDRKPIARRANVKCQKLYQHFNNVVK
jgi:hypothetical protein